MFCGRDSHVYHDKSRVILKHLSNQERSCSEVDRHSLMTHDLKLHRGKMMRPTSSSSCIHESSVNENHASLGWESRVTGNGICNEASFRPISEQFKSASRTVTHHWWKLHRFQLQVLQCSMERVYVPVTCEGKEGPTWDQFPTLQDFSDWKWKSITLWWNGCQFQVRRELLLMCQNHHVPISNQLQHRNYRTQTARHVKGFDGSYRVGNFSELGFVGVVMLEQRK
jgi:hypothetical protein